MEEQLWPVEFKRKNVEVPFYIVSEQAKKLGPLTDNCVLARVSKIGSASALNEGLPPDFAWDFELTAPKLRSYSYTIMHFAHRVHIYPTLIKPNSAIKKELGIKSEDGLISAKSEEEFKGYLKEILNTERLKDVIQSILALTDKNGLSTE